jgi:hypothetical protein
MSLSSTVLNLGGTRPRTRWLANIPTGKYACVVLVMYAPYAYEGACACVRPPEHIYYGPLVVDILTRGPLVRAAVKECFGCRQPFGYNQLALENSRRVGYIYLEMLCVGGL